MLKGATLLNRDDDDEGEHMHEDFPGLLLLLYNKTHRLRSSNTDADVLNTFLLLSKTKYFTGAVFKANIFSSSSHVIHSELTDVYAIIMYSSKTPLAQQLT